MVRDRWSLLVVLTCSYGLGAFGMLGVSPLSPALMQGFALSRFEVAFIVPSVYVGGLLFSLPGGHLADQWGVRPTLLGALALGGIGLLAAALAPHFVVFLLCLVIAGSGWSVVNPVLACLPVVSVQALGFSPVGAGVLIAAAQIGGAVARLGLGIASDRWSSGRRPPWLMLTSVLGAITFLVYAWAPTAEPVPAALLAFVAGIGAHGWVGIYFIISAEAGGAGRSGLLSGVSFAAIVVGLLSGAPLFGTILQLFDSYAAAWRGFAALSAVVAVVVAVFGAAIHRESQSSYAG